MLRSAVAFGVAKETLSVWLNMFREYAHDPSLDSLFPEGDEVRPRRARKLLGLAELRCVNADRKASLRLRPDQVELIWRSQLTWAVDGERDEVRYWTERMLTRG
jgi:hypothetical protein